MGRELLRGMVWCVVFANAVLGAGRVAALCGTPEECDDGNPCTDDFCVDGNCVHSSVSCDDGNVCTIDFCDPVLGCLNVPNPDVSCFDGDPCTQDICDAVLGCINPPLNCDDGDACTEDVCDGGTCLHFPLDCSDGDPCTDDACDPGIGCVFTPRACDDGDACTTDSCDPETGSCLHASVVCDDGDPCTMDSCDPLLGCVYTPVDCDDGNACTIDLCDSAFGCTHVPVDCDDSDPRTLDSCDVNTGCVHTPVDCDDDDSCTEDSYDAVLGCVHTPVDCDDDNACTVDTCEPGLGCVHTPVDCDDSDPRTLDSCDVNTGCVHTPVDCDDDNACTEDSYDVVLGCVHTPVDCDDDNACTVDTCEPGFGCVHTPVDCDDGDPGTLDSCDVNTGCVHTPVDCDDDDPCTQDVLLPGGGCAHLRDPNCPEGEPGRPSPPTVHSADQNADRAIDLTELLRTIQFYNSRGFHCAPGTEDGYAPGSGDRNCAPYAVDYQDGDWLVSLSELLRMIQFYNLGGYHPCADGEDGYCPWAADRIFERRPGWNRPALALESLTIDPVWAEPDATATFAAALRNTGTGVSDGGEMVFLVDGAEVARRVIDPLEPGEAATVSAHWIAGAPGRYTAEARIEVLPDEVRRSTSAAALTAQGFVVGDVEERGSPVAALRDADTLQILPDTVTELDAEVRNDSPVALGRVDVEVTIDGALAATESLPSLAAGGRAGVQVPWTALGPGQHVVQMELDPEAEIPPEAFQQFTAYQIVVSGIVFPTTPPWSSIGPRHIADSTEDLPSGSVGRIDVIAFHPTNANILYATAPWGGVWKSTNAGDSWSPLSDTMENLHARAIAIDPAAPDIVYISTGHSVWRGGSGIFKSVDGGATWTPFARKVRVASSDLPLGGANRIEVRRTTANNVLIYVASDLGLLRYESNNPLAPTSAPADWTTTKTGQVVDLAVSPASNDLLFISIKDEGLYRSTTGGLGAGAWSKLNNPPIGFTQKSASWYTFDVQWFAPRQIVAALADPHGGVPYHKLGTLGMWRTDNDSGSWTQVLMSNTDGLYNPFVRIAPSNNNVVYYGGVKLYKLLIGNTFSIVTKIPGVHDDMTGMAWDPHDPLRITYYVCCDGGLWRGTMDGGGDTLVPRNNDFRVTMFYDLDAAAQNPNLMIGGTQDNGTIAWTGTPDWTGINGGDGDYVLIVENDSAFYSQHQHLMDTKRCGLGLACTWKTWLPRNTGLPTGTAWGGGAYGENHAFITSLWRGVPGIPTTLAAQGDEVHLSFDGGQKWLAVGPKTPLRLGFVTRMQVQPSSNYLIAGTSQGQLWYSQVGGAWTLFWTHPDLAPLTSIAFSTVDPQVAYLSFIGAARADRRLYRLHFTAQNPAGAALDNITGNFPSNLVAGVLCADGYRADVCYAGTNKGGVYRYQGNDPAWPWTPYNHNLPWACEVRDLVLDPTTKELRAGTFGRGAWRVQPGP